MDRTSIVYRSDGISSVKMRVLCHGGQGGMRMRNYDVISGWQVWHLLIVHLNSFDLLCEMNGYAIYSPSNARAPLPPRAPPMVIELSLLHYYTFVYLFLILILILILFHTII